MLTQPFEADRRTTTPACFRTYNPLGLTARSGDLSDRATRTEYIHNVYGTWRRVYPSDRYFGDDY
jgi:hypothetical protein